MANSILTDAAHPVVLITGGSTGIGYALAEEFAQRGHTLVLVARDENRLATAAASLRAAFSIDVAAISADLTRADDLARVMATVAAQRQYVDILVNVAGMGISGPFASGRSEDLALLLKLNIEAPTILARACLPEMMMRGRGGIINVASIAGLVPVPYLSLYAASKSYLVALSRALAFEAKSSGVRISVVTPGPARTAFLFADGFLAGSWARWVPVLEANVVARVAYEGFMAGQSIVTPGFFGALCRLGLKFLPHQFVLWIVTPFLARLFDHDVAHRKAADRAHE